MQLKIDPSEIKGFLAPEEAQLLYEIALDRAQYGPCLEVGGYCGKSAAYIGSACRVANELLFSIDHHRGSEENQPGWEYFDDEVWDERAGAVDTLPFFRDTIRRAELEG
ncbi:MAG: class I SAM-dependent methyltransferase, partial [Pseudomonadota bacterium]